MSHQEDDLRDLPEPEPEDHPVLNERTPDEAEEIVRSALMLCEAYVRWAFEDRDLYRKTRGDEIQRQFRRYLEAAHPSEWKQMKLAEKGFSVPRVVIH